MQPRTLEQILAESSQYYTPQIEAIKARQQAIPGKIESDIQAAQAAQTKAYEDILSGARQRGLGFSGIPLSEQAKYASNVFAPEVLAAKSRGTEYGLSLADALNQIYERRYGSAQQQYNVEQQTAEQRRQFDINTALEREKMRLAASQAAASQAAASFSPTYYTPPTTTNVSSAGTNLPLPKINKTNAGYQFTDAYGTPINAAQYVQLYQSMGGGLTYRQLLQQMANTGDKNAQIALNYVGDDFKFGSAPESARGALTALGASGKFKKEPVQNIPTTISPQYTQNILKTRSLF